MTSSCTPGSRRTRTHTDDAVNVSPSPMSLQAAPLASRRETRSTRTQLRPSRGSGPLMASYGLPQLPRVGAVVPSQHLERGGSGALPAVYPPGAGRPGAGGPRVRRRRAVPLPNPRRRGRSGVHCRRFVGDQRAHLRHHGISHPGHHQDPARCGEHDENDHGDEQGEQAAPPPGRNGGRRRRAVVRRRMWGWRLRHDRRRVACLVGRHPLGWGVARRAASRSGR